MYKASQKVTLLARRYAFWLVLYIWMLSHKITVRFTIEMSVLFLCTILN